MRKDFNYRLVIKTIGSLLLLESLFILFAAITSIIYNESDYIYFLYTALGAFILGTCGYLIGRNATKLFSKREGSVIVTFIWVIFSFVGMMPFWCSGSIPSFTDAYFETISGFTTTGATVLTNIESLSHGMLFWRSITQWVGGLGIIVIFLAILPMFGFSGVQLYGAESTGPTKEKIHPQISGTAKRLGLIYLWLTLTECVILKYAGMNWFDAICHSFTTIATGGFSTKQNSIAYWDSPYIQYTILIFMFLSGINFSLYYYFFKGKLRKIWNNEEFFHYIVLVLFFTAIIAVPTLSFSNLSFSAIEHTVRESVFLVVSFITSTAFTTTNYMLMPSYVWFLLIILMFIGASACSTSGGIKIIRFVIVFKYCYYEFKRMVHPNAVIPVTYSNKVIRFDIVTRVMAFVILYFVIVAIGIVILCLMGMNLNNSIGAMVGCLGCTGLGFGDLGPSGSFAIIPDACKWFLGFVMLLGRLELFTVLLIFTPVFWKRN